MKKILFVILPLLVFATAMTAQVRFGFKAGMSSTDLSPSDFVVTNNERIDAFKVSVNDANYGVTAGAFLQIQMGSFFVMPEAMVHSSSVDFSFQDVTRFRSEVFRERYTNIDVPVTMGLKVGPLRMGVGPVGHFLVGGSSTLNDPNVSQKYDGFTLGYQAGLGLDIWNVVIDFRYEGNASRFGNTMTIAGEEVQFDQSPGRIIGTVGWRF